jgi:hypothetical protein
LQDVLLSKAIILQKGDNILDAAVSNMDGFQWRDTCVSSIQPYRPIWRKTYLHLKYLS